MAFLYLIVFSNLKASEDQYGWQGELINRLESQLGNGIFKAYVPGYYYGTSADLSAKWAVLDTKIKKEIPFVWSGNSVWTENIKKSDIPYLSSGRKLILWDNWIASDSSDAAKLNVDPPEFREKALIDTLKEYWLNLVFPSYNTVPAIASISQVMSAGSANYSYYWSQDRKYYANLTKINNVLKIDASTWCKYLNNGIACSQTQLSSYFELLKGINWMTFNPNNIQVSLLDPRIQTLAENIKART